MMVFVVLSLLAFAEPAKCEKKEAPASTQDEAESHKIEKIENSVDKILDWKSRIESLHW